MRRAANTSIFGGSPGRIDRTSIEKDTGAGRQHPLYLVTYFRIFLLIVTVGIRLVHEPQQPSHHTTATPKQHRTLSVYHKCHETPSMNVLSGGVFFGVR